VRDEEERAEAISICEPARPGNGRLQRRVAPIVAFTGRLDAAVLRAEAMAQAVYEMSEMSQSLGSRRAVMVLDEADEAEEGECTLVRD
jgi:hypothetical protein